MKAQAPIDEVRLLRTALRGDDEARRSLVRYLTPVIHARAADHVARRRRAGGRGTRADVDDLVQEVWAHLLRDRQATLRRWDPARGASLVTFVGLCARRIIVGYDRGGARRGLREVGVDFADVDATPSVTPPHDQRLEHADLAHKLMSRLSARLSLRGRRALQAMFVDGLSVAEAEPVLGMTKSALYSWRRDIKSEARQVLDELEGLPDGSR